MGGAVLVAFASDHDPARKAAEVVARELSAVIERVDVLPVQDVEDLEPYRAIVVGSSVRSRRPRPEAVEFVQRHQGALGRVPVAFFFTGACFNGTEDMNRAQAERYVRLVCREAHEIRPIAIGAFGILDERHFDAPDRVTRRRNWVPESALHEWRALGLWAATLEMILMIG